MRHHSSATRAHRYELGRATVFVKASSTGVLDGLIRCKFMCQVHPVGGGPVYECEVMAFFDWHAANIALEKYETEKREAGL